MLKLKLVSLLYLTTLFLNNHATAYSYYFEHGACNCKLEIVTSSPEFKIISYAIASPVKISLLIWDSFLFKIVSLVLILILVLYTIVSFNFKKKRLNALLLKQHKLIKAERQRISSEIHDDVASGIFAIHLFVELASKKKESAEELQQINLMIEEISAKIKEIIWSTNIDNDNLENLLYYIQYQITQLLVNTDIAFSINIPDEIIYLNVNRGNRKNIYLAIKELVHNVIKHAKASELTIDIDISDNIFTVLVKDNGIGFNPDDVKPNAMGLENVKSRILKLNGEFSLKAINGTEVFFKIPLDNMSLDYMIL